MDTIGSLPGLDKDMKQELVIARQEALKQLDAIQNPDIGTMTRSKRKYAELSTWSKTTLMTSKNQVNYIRQRVGALIFKKVLAHTDIGLANFGNMEGVLRKPMKIDNTKMHGLFCIYSGLHLKGREPSHWIHRAARSHAVELSKQLDDPMVGAEIIKIIANNGKQDVYWIVGNIMLSKHNTHPSCPFCRTEMNVNILKNRFATNKHDMCCIGGSGQCVDGVVPLTAMPCSKCYKPSNKLKICLPCLHSSILSC